MSDAREWRRRALALLAAAAVAVPLGATLILPQDILQVTAASSDVVRGRVASLASRWDYDRTLIVTDVVIEVEETFKGEAKGDVVLTLFGGRVDDLVLDVEGSPSFAVGEDVVVFARRERDGSLSVPNLYQGKYRVETDGGALWISNERYSLAELVPAKAAALDAAGRMAWGQFRAELERAVRQSPGGAR